MKTFLILAGVGVVSLLLLILFIFSEKNGHEKEREWFIHKLGYEFSVAVDSVQRYNRTFVEGRITDGRPRLYREDSLKNSLKKHQQLIFVSRQRNDSVRFMVQTAEEIRKGDSVRISSQENSITVFREGNQVLTVKLSQSLIGWGKPPFRTK
ncbi:MAG TPA: hypothetical protein VFM90_09270 [Cyclobacteriaceae bacterium]|nr:hypothetical protein [Cyclobacteriaceae bacterium]